MRWKPIPTSPTRRSWTCSPPISAAAPATRTSSRRYAARRPSCAVPVCADMPIDVHAHYVPPQLIAAIDARGKDIGVSLARANGATPALQFAYGFKVRPFFPRLVEPAVERRAWLDQERIDRQIVGTWPDIFG